jgi:phenylacetate-CoA ligase
MPLCTSAERRRFESLSADELAAHQLARLNELLKAILPRNRFYAEKYASALDADALRDPAGPLRSLADLKRLPFTVKEELLPDQPSDHFARNRTFPLEQYVRFHRTSGTRGRPLVVVDTAEDWRWWLDCWQYVLDAAEVTADDRVLLAFSFGPFVGFWSAFDAAVARGSLVVPAGGLNSLGRLELARDCQATVMLCTPSYALHLAEVAETNQISAQKLGIRRLVLAGEPGGSSPTTRARIEAAWNARVLDHSGATEVGPWGFGDAAGSGLHVTESEFLAEFVSRETGEAAAEGELAELVLTPLGRVGSPVIRYRTGDLVRPTWRREGANRFVHLTGGVIGRTDDMLIVRGVNVFPSSLEQIIHGFPEIVEYRVILRRVAEMDHIVVQVEDHLNDPQRVAKELQLRLGLKTEVQAVPLGSLPRFEGKGRRLVDERGASR